MSMLVTLIAVVSILGIVWWALTQIPLPQPLRIAVSVIFAIIAIVMLLQFVTGAGLRL